LRGDEIRESLQTRNWDKAVELVRQRETEVPGPSAQENEPTRFDTARVDFVADLHRRGLVPATISKYELLFRQMQEFATGKGIRYLQEFDLPTAREFCNTWTQGNNTALKSWSGCARFSDTPWNPSG
jgi:hypothetical protein